jgi:GNAT superfamily N-acetyltransferase
MTIRHASADDRDALRSLWEAWQAELPDAPPWADTSWEANEPELDRALAANALFVAEDDGGAPIGFVSSWLENHVGRIGDLYVEPRARGTGTGRALVSAVVENLRARGATYLFVSANLDAMDFYERLGFREESRTLVLTLEVREVADGRSYGSIHIQTDDVAGVERAVRQFVPRLPGGSRGSIVTPPRNGWITVYDDVGDRDPAMLRRLAAELADRTGAVLFSVGVEHGQVVRFVLFEAGRVVDEYLSVPEFYGALPSGEVIALAANPRVVARLTGADAATVRAVARTAQMPDELPPPNELLANLVAAIGVEGATYGWSDAPEIPGAIVVKRA